MYIQPPIQMNTCVPVDVHKLIRNRFCVSRTLRLMVVHLLLHLNILIRSYNYWMTGELGLESEFWIGVGSIVFQVEMIAIVSL